MYKRQAVLKGWTNALEEKLLQNVESSLQNLGFLKPGHLSSSGALFLLLIVISGSSQLECRFAAIYYIIAKKQEM